MLERDAESFQIQDANGLDRFKSGFVVDNFSGHKVGDVQHKDYKIAMDGMSNLARPTYKANGVSLIENATTDAARTTLGYKKTGDLITLPYTEELFTEQPYATRVERLTPVLISQWIGVRMANAMEWCCFYFKHFFNITYPHFFSRCLSYSNTNNEYYTFWFS